MMSTNQIDDVSLEAVVRAAERSASHFPMREVKEFPTDKISWTYPEKEPTVWSNATYNATDAERAEVARALVASAESKGFSSAGYLEMRAGSVASFDPTGKETGAPAGTIRYDTYTQAQCSMTVRHPKGVGSGWAGLSAYDWGKIDGSALATRALDKCIASLNPVVIEPGRYTAILEPQAVADLVERLLIPYTTLSISRTFAEEGQGPWYLGPDPAARVNRLKLGLKVVDERITISHDPADPLLGELPIPGMKPLTWIERGVLKQVGFGGDYALGETREYNVAVTHRAYRMSGGDTTVDDMIATTKRGLLVTRFSGLAELDPHSVLMTGLTRDGLWLIENGKITKAVKNFRITESPLFVMNQIEQLGVPVPVFRPERSPDSAILMPAIVPPLKVRDFSFTSLVDAI
jgi:predicted Zn-dependent protease